MEKIRKGDNQKRKDAGALQGRKVAKKLCVFQCFVALEGRKVGSKSRLAKAAGAGTSEHMRNEKLHAVVARSTFASENVQITSGSDRFWKLRCRRSARRCGAKHISK